MTRASNDPLTGGERGARSCRAISFIIPSSSLRTMHLAQQLTEPVAGAHDAHLQRRNTNPGELRHFVVTQVFHVLQEEGFPLVGTKLLQSAIDLLAPRVAFGRLIFRRLEHRPLGADESPCPPSSRRRV